ERNTSARSPRRASGIQHRHRNEIPRSRSPPPAPGPGSRAAGSSPRGAGRNVATATHSRFSPDGSVPSLPAQLIEKNHYHQCEHLRGPPRPRPPIEDVTPRAARLNGECKISKLAKTHQLQPTARVVIMVERFSNGVEAVMTYASRLLAGILLIVLPTVM